MKPNNYLIPVSIDGQAIGLPCNGYAFLEMTVTRMRGGEPSKADLVSFLVAHPALLISAICAFEAGEITKASSLRRWFQCCDTQVTELQKSSADGFGSVQKFWKQLDKSKTNKGFWKAVEKFAFSAVGIKLKLKPKRVTELSAGLIKLIGKSARQLAKSNSDVGIPLDLPSVLAELNSLQKIKNDFEAELLRQKLDSMRLLAYGASHEINNPLANVATRAQSLLQDEPDLKRRHRLAVIYEQAMRAHEMISDMMLFAHPPALELTSLNLAECIGQVTEELGPRLTRSNINCEILGAAPNMVGDTTKLSSAIKSLLVNAMEAIGSDGKVAVELGTEAGGSIWLSVSDDGPGVDPAISENIFDPFFSGREAGRGLGFGLSKAWRVLQLHDATIRRTASELGGAKFVISFSKTIELASDSSTTKSIAA